MAHAGDDSKNQNRPAAIAAPDKYRGSLSAGEVAEALAEGARRAAYDCRVLPLADGGEGTLEALGGANRATGVSGPLGEQVTAGWRLEAGVAVIEAAQASGLALLGGAAKNDPVRASTRGTGELIGAALDAGAERVIVAVGGSATTDGGLGAVETLLGRGSFSVPVVVACDVRTPFLEAAAVFGPQKGASPGDVELLTARLMAVAARYRDEFGVDVTGLPGAGAAGGLAGGLVALGAELVPGFELVAEQVGFERALSGVDVVLTGEGRLDRTSFAGKVVGGVLGLCAPRGLRTLVVAGEVEDGTSLGVSAVSLVQRFGRQRAWADPEECIAEAVAEALDAGRPADQEAETGP
jgi:glycerate 2-kinase